MDSAYEIERFILERKLIERRLNKRLWFDCNMLFARNSTLIAITAYIRTQMGGLGDWGTSVQETSPEKSMMHPVDMVKI